MPRRALAPCRPRRGVGERGSAFVDAMIAAAIVALALGTTFQVIGASASRERGLEARRVALLLAQSELDAVGASTPLQPGEQAGLQGDLVWRVEVTPYEDAGEAGAAGGLWRVSVRVRPRAGGPDLATLETLRLGRGA